MEPKNRMRCGITKSRESVNIRKGKRKGDGNVERENKRKEQSKQLENISFMKVNEEPTYTSSCNTRLSVQASWVSAESVPRPATKP